MKYLFLVFTSVLLASCKQGDTTKVEISEATTDYDYTLVFASCNDQDRPQPLWEPILANNPDLFIWGGDNIYADTDDMAKMKSDYDKVLANTSYQKLMKSTEIIGTWDDHDYGKNDAGREWEKKEEAKKLFLEFLNIPSGDERHQMEGVYSSYRAKVGDHTLKFILLDTRTFRDSLLKSEVKGRRYEPWPQEDTHRTLLGAQQWDWLETELKDESADFNVIVTSIQYLNNGHGWERWGCFPSEMEKMDALIANAKSKNIILLSGDRHMAEISVAEMEGLSYPLVDFTTSGMTHTWIDGETERNEHRVSNVIKRLNFGVIHFDFDARKVVFEIRGEDDFLYERHEIEY
ncbi:MAG: hypothetical protein Aureis2KO_13240 [Aureisphaera sp.]